MPEMDGLAVCREIRKTSDMPILFLSSRADEVDRVVGFGIGGDDYVTKPFKSARIGRPRASDPQAHSCQPVGDDEK